MKKFVTTDFSSVSVSDESRDILDKPDDEHNFGSFMEII